MLQSLRYVNDNIQVHASVKTSNGIHFGSSGSPRQIRAMELLSREST